MAKLTNKKFGVVHTSPSNLITNAASLEEGKLYFAAGDASGAVKQGVYGVVGLTADGSIVLDGTGTDKTVAMFGTGAIADGTGYGLSQANFTTAEKDKLASIDTSANNYSLPLATNDVRGGIQVGFTANDASIPVQLSNEKAYVKLTKTSIEKGLGYTINASVPSDAKFTDTDTWRAIKVNGTQQIANNASTALDISAGNNIEVSFTNNKVVIAAKNVDASNADSANKVSNTFDVSFNGTKILSFDGSENTTLAFKDSSNIDITNSNGTLTFSTKNIPTKDEVSTAISTAMGNLTGALLYKGTVTAASELPLNASTGHVYVASVGFTYNDGSNNWAVESGDMFIYNGTKWNIVSGENQVVNGDNGTNATLTHGANGVKIATVDGTDIKVDIPALPSIVNTLNDKSGALTTLYDTSILSTANGAYRAGTLTIAGKTHIIYGKDTDTVYVHPASINGTTSAESSLKSTTTSLSHEGTFTVATGVYRDASGHISKVATETFMLPSQYSHPAAGTGSVNTPTNSSTAATLLTRVKIDSSGHVTDTAAFDGTVGGTITPIYFKAGVPTPLDYTIATSVPSTAIFTDEKVKANTSAGKIYLVGQDDSTNGTTESVYKNASVYMESGKMYATSGLVESDNAALVTGGAVYTAVEAATIYWETL